MRNNLNTGISVTLGACLVPWTAAAAIPNAASVASPPLVVGGLIVGLALLAVFASLLVRTVRSMKEASTVSADEVAQREADLRLREWEETRDIDVVRRLIDALANVAGTAERTVFARALSDITGRFLGTDQVAWEVWWRRDSQEFMRSRRFGRMNPIGGEFLPVN